MTKLGNYLNIGAIPMSYVDSMTKGDIYIYFVVNNSKCSTCCIFYMQKSLFNILMANC